MTIDPQQRLSPHFRLGEFLKSQTAERLDIDNAPPPEAEDWIVGNLERLARDICEPVRAHFGTPFRPNSGFRCLELNRALGSSDNSQHVQGQAVDIELPGVPNGDLAKFIERELDFDQLILEFYTPGRPRSGWVHVSVKGEGNRGEVLTIGKTAEGAPFTNIGLTV